MHSRDQNLIPLVQADSFRRKAESAFAWFCRLAAVSVALVVFWIVVQVAIESIPAIKEFGIGFLVEDKWDPVKGIYGVLPQILGTIVSSVIALFIAVPVAVGTAIVLSEDFIAGRLRKFLSLLVELLAAIPSVIYGLWGIYVLVPLMRSPANWLNDNFGWFPLFNTPLSGPGLLPAALVLAFMILPMITALARDTLETRSADYRHSAYALGATRWQTIFKILLPASARGIFAAVMLALGRAMGETMAVAMLIGNSGKLSSSLFAPWTSIASHLANQFSEADGIQLSALMYSALVLFAITVLVNILARILIRRN